MAYLLECASAKVSVSDARFTATVPEWLWAF